MEALLNIEDAVEITEMEHSVNKDLSEKLKSDMKTDGAGHRKVTRVEPAINGVESKEINKSAEKKEESKDENNPE